MELPTFFLLSFCFRRRVLCMQPGRGRILYGTIVGVLGGVGSACAVAPAAGGKGLHCLLSCLMGACFGLKSSLQARGEAGKKEGRGVRLEHQEGQGGKFDVRRDLAACVVWACGVV